MREQFVCRYQTRHLAPQHPVEERAQTGTRCRRVEFAQRIIPRSKEMGMVITACANVTPDGKAFPGQPAIHDDSNIPGLKKLAQAIQAQGGRALDAAVMNLHNGFSALCLNGLC